MGRAVIVGEGRVVCSSSKGDVLVGGSRCARRRCDRPGRWGDIFGLHHYVHVKDCIEGVMLVLFEEVWVFLFGSLAPLLMIYLNKDHASGADLFRPFFRVVRNAPSARGASVLRGRAPQDNLTPGSHRSSPT